MNGKRLLGAALVGVLILLGACSSPPAEPATLQPQATVPAGFSDARVTSVSSPTALAFLPDGAMLIATQPGTLRLYRNGALLATPVLDLRSRVCAGLTQGLLGVAVDPAFAQNGYLYLYYTFDKAGTGRCERSLTSQVVNRVSRFTVVGRVTSASSERVLIDNIPSPFGGHNAGDLHLGKDGLLYVSTGDGGCDYAGGGCAALNDAARDPHVLLGKILRVTRSGGIPATNPYQGTDSARCHVAGRTTPGKRCQETYASGLRNPFRLAFDPNAAGTRFFINDVGQNLWEEVNLGQPGADYGWNAREGACATGSATNCGAAAGFTAPLFSYRHGATSGALAGCSSITGGAFVPNGLWPGFSGSYLFSDYVCGKIFRLDRVDGNLRASVLASGLGESSAVHLAFGPDGALYYTSYAGGGEVRRLRYVGAANQPPEAEFSAAPTAGPAPLRVAFDASGSRDPEGGALRYSWTFGDGASGSGAKPVHTYADSGVYTATLTVRDPQGLSATATTRIGVGNTPPTPTITAPSSGTLFGVGERIVLRGRATDAEEGALSAERLSWRVLLRHDDHTHPYAEATGRAELTLTMPPPEDLAAVPNSYLEVYLTATDRAGLSRTVYQKVGPKRVNVTLRSEPSGLKLKVDGETVTAPKTVASWVGYPLTLAAPAQSTPNGTATFRAWSDGGAQTHTVVSSAATPSYTATFAVAGQAVTSLTLIDADRDRPVAGYDPIPNGATLDLAKLPTRRLNLRANTAPDRVGSVRFSLNGGVYRTENSAPYAFANNTGTDYHAWTPSLGVHTVTATPYSLAGAGGVAGTAKSVRFTVTDSR